jgi:putative endonuclease
MSKYYAYLARCNDDSLYTGYTNNLKEREAKHNEGKGARYTSMRRPIKIVYYEEFETKSAAMKREYQLKHLSKKNKEDLTSSIS